jgi:septum site-determining protein MinC
MNDNNMKLQAFKLKGRLFTHKVIEVYTTDLHAFKVQLMTSIASAPRLFAASPVVIDCRHIKGQNWNLSEAVHCLRSQGLLPMGIQHSDSELEACALSLGLALMKSSASQDKDIMALRPPSAKLNTVPVRSGQQAVNREGDLVVMAAVSPGAELLALGHIHVYGTLRGRALAGIQGDYSARIFCQALDAELLSIAGVYRLRDAFEPIDKPCQIFLEDGRICIEAFV